MSNQIRLNTCSSHPHSFLVRGKNNVPMKVEHKATQQSLNTPSTFHPSSCFPGSVCTHCFGHSPINGTNITAFPGKYVLHHISQTILLHKFSVVFMLGLGKDCHMSCWEERNFSPRNSALLSQLPAKPLGQFRYLRFPIGTLFQ